MPRTKVRKPTNKRNRNSDDDGLKIQLKEVQRIHDQFESEATMIWQRRKEDVADLFAKFRCNLSHVQLEMTMDELKNGKLTKTDSILSEVSESVTSKLEDDGTYYYCYNTECH